MRQGTAALLVFSIFAVSVIAYSYIFVVENTVLDCSNVTNTTNYSVRDDCAGGMKSGSAASPTISTQSVEEIEVARTEEEPESLLRKINEVIPIGALVLVLALAAFVIFSVLMRKPIVEEIEVSRALSSDTRVGIMAELLQGARIPTDLSSKLGKSKSTIVEHLEKLMEAQLVERIEEPGKKFVFYRLTTKGKSLLRKAG
ncbi:winged helix-turn-helix transcriptional regulator [Candidatus Micrarchaeota archaeon]|nr:winged helix-turn-helix transcriptional regulator [Candidatus Micrarchaeota archaeon]